MGQLNNTNKNDDDIGKTDKYIIKVKNAATNLEENADSITKNKNLTKVISNPLEDDISLSSLARNIVDNDNDIKYRKSKIPKLEVYEQKPILETFKTDFVVFKSYLLDAKSLVKVETSKLNSFLTTKEYIKNLLNNS